MESFDQMSIFVMRFLLLVYLNLNVEGYVFKCQFLNVSRMVTPTEHEVNFKPKEFTLEKPVANSPKRYQLPYFKFLDNR